MRLRAHLCVSEDVCDERHVRPHVGLLRNVEVLGQADALKTR